MRKGSDDIIRTEVISNTDVYEYLYPGLKFSNIPALKYSYVPLGFPCHPINDQPLTFLPLFESLLYNHVGFNIFPTI